MKTNTIISKKKRDEILSHEEISFIIDNYTNDKIKDKEMTKFLKLICEKGLSEEETIDLTKAMINTGSILDLKDVSGLKADKHSTGGVGDKTTLVVGALVSSCDVNVAKMSGRALGFTGGTIDKLESIPGFKIDLSKEEFITQLKDTKFAITSQTNDLVKADKKIYALRDVTNTVSSIPLIASSIMSKKIATAADIIVLDVKVGNGALIKTIDEARELSNLMIKIGQAFNKKVIAILSSMDEPLGYAIGNSLEIEEIIEVLKNEGDNNLIKLCKEISTYMVMLAKNISYVEALIEVEEALNSGKAYHKLLEIIVYQNGDISKLPKAEHKLVITSSNTGYVKKVNCQLLGEYAMKLGAGRTKKEDKIDYTVGLKIHKKIGDYVSLNDPLLTIFSNKQLKDIKDLQGFIIISEEKSMPVDIILEIIK